MDRPRRESRQHNGITLRGLSQPTFATKSANIGHHHRLRFTPLPEKELVTAENSPPKPAAADQLFFQHLRSLSHFTSTKKLQYLGLVTAA
jgi:hypothetical protein